MAQSKPEDGFEGQEKEKENRTHTHQRGFGSESGSDELCTKVSAGLTLRRTRRHKKRVFRNREGESVGMELEGGSDMTNYSTLRRQKNYGRRCCCS